MQKGLKIGLFFIILIFSCINVFAQQTYQEGINGFIVIIQNILGITFAAIFNSSDFIFEKVLFLTILIAAVYSAAKKFPAFAENKAIIWIITISVSLLATRFLTEAQWVQAILLPYSVLGVVLLSVIPFIIFFYYVEMGVESEFLRRVCWILYAVVFIGIWWSRYPVIGQPAWIFIATAVIAILMMLFDRTIQGFFVRSAIRQGLRGKQTMELVKLQKQINEKRELLSSAGGNQR